MRKGNLTAASVDDVKQKINADPELSRLFQEAVDGFVKETARQIPLMDQARIDAEQEALANGKKAWGEPVYEGEFFPTTESKAEFLAASVTITMDADSVDLSAAVKAIHQRYTAPAAP